MHQGLSSEGHWVSLVQLCTIVQSGLSQAVITLNPDTGNKPGHRSSAFETYYKSQEGSDHLDFHLQGNDKIGIVASMDDKRCLRILKRDSNWCVRRRLGASSAIVSSFWQTGLFAAFKICRREGFLIWPRFDFKFEAQIRISSKTQAL